MESPAPAPANELLITMAKGEVAVQAIAAQLMAGRRLGGQGKCVGFEKAAEIWNVKDWNEQRPGAEGIPCGTGLFFVPAIRVATLCDFFRLRQLYARHKKRPL